MTTRITIMTPTIHTTNAYRKLGGYDMKSLCTVEEHTCSVKHATEELAKKLNHYNDSGQFDQAIQELEEVAFDAVHARIHWDGAYWSADQIA